MKSKAVQECQNSKQGAVQTLFSEILTRKNNSFASHRVLLPQVPVGVALLLQVRSFESQRNCEKWINLAHGHFLCALLKFFLRIRMDLDESGLSSEEAFGWWEENETEAGPLLAMEV